MEMRLLGRFLVLQEDREIPAAAFGGRKVRALLRILATRRGEFVGHDALAEMLWADRPPADPAANLGVLVNRARHALDDPSLVRTGPGGYALAGGPAWKVDAEQFLVAVGDCRELAGREALAAYGAALGRWGEPLAEDVDAPWAAVYRQRLIRCRQEALEHAAQLALGLGEPTVAVEFASVAVGTDPLREAAALLLVRALREAGDTAAAVEHYEAYRRRLADELGLDPSPEGAALQALLLRAGSAPPRAVRPVPAGFSGLEFVGRDTETAAAVAVLRGRSGGVVTIAGRSGSGKSRLLHEISGRVRTVTARAYLPERAEPWSLTRTLLREVLAVDPVAPSALPAAMRSALGMVVPEIEPEPGVIADPESRRALVMEGSVRLLAAVDDVAVLFDDMQWADPSSLRLLEVVLDRLPELPVALAYRPEELEPAGEVRALLARLRPALVLELGALPDAAVERLTASPELVSVLATHTDRTPLAIAEVLRALAREGLASCDAHGRWRIRTSSAVTRATELAAAGQRRSIGTRIDQQLGAAGELLRLLALVSREVPARTLAQAAGEDERQVLDMLSVLATRGLVRLGEQGWAMVHDMVGEVVAERLNATDRGRLHALLAEALVADHAEAAEVARHWERAGDTRLAAEAYVAAAREALDAFADQEAAALATAGLQLQATGGSLSSGLWDVRGEARRRLGDLVGARADLRAALAGHPAGPLRAALLARLATLASGSDDLVRAAELAELAIIEAGSDAPVRAQALEVAAVIDMNLGRPGRAAERAATALSLYQQAGDARGTACVLDGRTMAAFLDGDIRGAVASFQRVANLFEDCGDLVRLVTPRSTCGHGLVFLDRPADGLRETSAALDTARVLGHPEGQAYALWHRSEAFSALGRTEEAVVDAQEALTIARRLGHRGWTATSWRAVGIAQQTAGELDAALEAFGQSLACSEHLGLFASWAAARSALVLVALDRATQAEPLVRRAGVEGPPLGHYEARLAEVELAVALGRAGVARLAAAALARAVAGGHLASVARLTSLAT